MSEIKSEEKIWEKPWDIKELHTHSTSWSLAGDAGLLLQLKQFSENIISKSILIEKQLQTLSFEEQQCSTQLNNSISSFLVLENSQFIENRVYEEDLSEAKAQPVEAKPPEKTKEEKEQELFAKINEALNVGMSIMDNYFDKIDVNALKKEGGSDDEDEGEEEIEAELKKLKGAEELIIYETKDPYVLHSLPYLIGSQSYLENDHVGLKDFDSEEETEEEELEVEDEDEDENMNEEDIDEPTKDQSKRKDSMSTQSNDDSEKSDVFGSSSKKKYENDDSDDKSDDETDDDDEMFKTKKKNTNNLFSDDEDNIEEEKKRPKQKSEENEFSGSESEGEKNGEPEPVNIPKALDFASELSSRLASKKKRETSNNNETEVSTENTKVKVEDKPQEAKKAIKTNAISLFDNSSDEEEGSMFTSKPKTVTETNNKTVKKASLFSESDSDKEDSTNKSKAVSNEQAKSNETTKTTKVLPKIDSDSSDDIDFLKKPPQLEPKKSTAPAVKIEKKFSIFDDDDEDSDDLLKVKPSISKAVTNKEKETEKIVAEEKTKPQTTLVQKPKSSLFDEDDDDDLFKDTNRNKSEIITTTTIPEIKEETEVNQQSKTKGKKILFDPSALKSSGLFNKLSENTSKEKSDDESPLSNNPLKESIDINKKPNIVKEIPKEEISNKKSSLFDDAEEDDLFSVVKSLPKKEKPNPKKENLFEDTQDKKDEQSAEKKTEEMKAPPSIFKEEKEITQNIPILKTNPVKKSLFDNSSDEEGEDDLFSSKKQAPKITPQPKKDESNETFSNKIVADKNVLNPIVEPEEVPKKSDPVTESSEIKNSNTAEEIKIETKPTPATGKNRLFDPLSLKSSGLFKKLAQTNTNDSDENDDDKKPENKDDSKENAPIKQVEILDSKKIIQIKNELDESDDFFGFSSPKINLKKNSALNDKKPSIFDDPIEKKESNEKKIENNSKETPSSSLSNQESELFEGIKTDRSFSEQSFKNVQKDRIKVSAKKRAPTQRPKAAVIDLESDLFDKHSSFIGDIAEVNTEKPILDKEIGGFPTKEESKATSESLEEEVIKIPKMGMNKGGKNLLFDPLALKSSDLFKKAADKKIDIEDEVKSSIDDSLFSIKKTTKEISKKDTIFDDEDLFETKKPAKEIKPNKENNVKVERKADDNSFDELFKSMAAKKDAAGAKNKTALVNIFDDDDIFSNNSLPKTSKTTAVNPVVKKKIDDDIFGDMNDDDDIFKPSNNKSKKKPNETKTKNEMFDDFEDPLK